MPYRVRLTTSADQLREEIEAADQSGVGCAVIAGGDGTWHGAVNAAAGRSLPLALLPIGTGDDNARSLGLPRNRPEELAELIAAGSHRTIDAGVVRDSAGDTRLFSGVLSAGFDSRVNERANAFHQWPSTTRYLAATIVELRGLRPMRYRIELDGVSQVMDAHLVAVGNGRYYGGGMAICPGAMVDDGTLEVVAIGDVSRWRFVTSFPSVFRGRHVEQPYVHRWQARSVVLAVDDGSVVPVYADGEPVTRLPIEVTIAPGALTVIAP